MTTVVEPIEPTSQETTGPANGGTVTSTDTIGAAWMLAKRETDHRAEGRKLGNCQIDKQNTSFDDVNPEIGVQAHKHQTGGKRRGHEAEHVAHLTTPVL